MNALEVKNISKIYKSYHSNLARVASWFGLASKSYDEAQVLFDVNFNVKHAQSIGIIGQNGAGKSTLLKIITGTLKASSGSIKANGAICSILELGMGFCPELNGLSNVYYVAGLMGHSKDEINDKLEYIKNFADIGEYFYKPVRLYSSGMQVRLAFAIVTAWQPKILIIDEALSVGDAYFQHKSFARIKELKESGTTLLLVSHDLPAIASICERAILLEKGRVLKDDVPSVVIDYYNALISKKEGVKIEQIKSEHGVMTISGTGQAKIKQAYICDENGQRGEIFSVGQRVRLHFVVKAYDNLDDIAVGFTIKDRVGQKIYGTNSFCMKQSQAMNKEQVKEFIYELDLDLGEGSYSISVALHAGFVHVESNYQWCDNLLVFELINNTNLYFVGLAHLKPKLIIKDF